MKLFYIVVLMVLSSVVASASMVDSLMHQVDHYEKKGLIQEAILAYGELLRELQNKEHFSQVITESENALLLADQEN